MRGPGPLGYAAYTKLGITTKKGQWVGEYIGKLRPLDSGDDDNSNNNDQSMFVIPNKCMLDARKAGNWTRFINSNCRPNLQCAAEFVGKRSVILFQAKRDIGPGEELTFKYGRDYFKNAGFSCICSTCEQ